MVPSLKIICLVLVLTSLSSCNPPQQEIFPWNSFSGNGEHFSYTRRFEGLSYIYIFDKYGIEVKKINRSDASVLDGRYIGDEFYHTTYKVGKTDNDPSISKIFKCTLYIYDCEEIYSSKGSITCLFGLKDRIFFFHSKSWRKDVRGRSYNQFVIRSTAKEAGGAITEYGRSFVPDMCPVVFEGKAYGAFSIPFDNTMQIVDGGAFLRSDRIISLVDGNIKVDQIDLVPRGSVRLLLHIPDIDLNFIGLNKGNGYIYGNCINLSVCDIEKKQTNPIIIDNKIYYGEWNNSKDLINIRFFERER